jgi:hypothetical protein
MAEPVLPEASCAEHVYVPILLGSSSVIRDLNVTCDAVTCLSFSPAGSVRA